MDIKSVIASQYLAALEMLSQAVEKCPGSMWNDPFHKNKFWHIAYHALFYTDLYLHPSGDEFVVWDKHRDNHEFLGPVCRGLPMKNRRLGRHTAKKRCLNTWHYVRTGSGKWCRLWT